MVNETLTFHQMLELRSTYVVCITDEGHTGWYYTGWYYVDGDGQLFDALSRSDVYGPLCTITSSIINGRWAEIERPEGSFLQAERVPNNKHMLEPYTPICRNEPVVLD